MKYITIFLSVFFSFIILEFFVRFFLDNGMNYEIEMMKYANQLKIISNNKEIGIEHKKNKEGVFMGTKIILNSDGFRNSNNLKSNSKKILMLGDSMTLGWGANKPFANILNKKIRNYEVINAGIGNTNTIMQVENFFNNHESKYKYDIIVLNFFINDFENVKVKEPNIIEKYSLFYTFFLNKLNTILIKFRLKKNWIDFYSGNYKNEKIIEISLNKILKLNNYCKKNNIKFLIHNIPELRNLNNYKFNEETNIIKNFADKNKIKFIDSYDVLKKFKPEELWVTKLDPHANDKAHLIMANFILKKISYILN